MVATDESQHLLIAAWAVQDWQPLMVIIILTLKYKIIASTIMCKNVWKMHNFRHFLVINKLSPPLPHINVENYYFDVAKVCAVKSINLVKGGGGKKIKGGAWKGFPKHFCTRL